MTSAAELFYTRRSRVGRDTDPGLGFGLDRNPHPPTHHFDHRHHSQSRHGRHDNGLNSLRRVPPHARHLCPRVSQTDRESPRTDLTPSQPGTSNNRSSENSGGRINRPRLSINDRLPGDVLEARARLLERLRGFSLTINRFPTTSRDDYVTSEPLDDEGGDPESEILMEGSTTAYFVSRSASPSLLPSLSQKKPPGLARDTINSLPCEVFHESEPDGRTEQCCICLETYREGDKLICLPCGHRYHPMCLDPWVQSCGDCPYCRTSIDCGASNTKPS